MIVRFSIVNKVTWADRSRLFAVLTVSVALLTTNSVFAQSTGGALKLGQPERQTTTLDLGATPSQDKEAPPPSQPTLKTSTGSLGVTPDEPTSSTKHVIQGAWEVACDSSGAHCAMAQIGKDESGTPVLEMVIRKLDDPLEVGDRTAIAVLDIITPLGVVLTEGLTVVIDGGRPETASFQICTEQGCLVREPIDEDLVFRFKRGNNALVTIVAQSQGKVNSSLSLSGFTKAFNSLQ